MITGQHDAALQTYRDAIKRYPTSLSLRYIGLDVLRFNDLSDELGLAQADLFNQLQRSFGAAISRDNLVAAGRFLTDRGEDARKVLELFYDRVRDRDPDFVDVYIATAELAIKKGDFKVAAETLRSVVKLDPTNPEIHYLLATALESGDSKSAILSIQTAKLINPRHIPSMLFMAEQAIDREQYDDAERQIAEVLRINIHQPNAWALLAVIANVNGQFNRELLMHAAALSSWRENPEVDYLIGKKLAQKYRFEEATRYQSRALDSDPSFSPASFELANDLLRLGEESIGWQIAEQVGEADPYNVVAYNLLTLKQKTSEFSILERDGIKVRMEQREAQIYGNEVLDLLLEAKRILCDKYEVVPEKTIWVEIYPEQNDFAIRTFGLPGGAGYLGVCFGRVITANSPASQGERPANWQSVLWHEFCHVVTLEKTRNRMPRWLSEGISVYEERQRDPSWGERMSPSYRMMMLGEDLTPVSDLSAAFLSPKSPLHLQFAYYESSLVIEFLVERYGLDSLLAVLDELAGGVPINDAMTMHMGTMDKLDQQFREYAQTIAKEYGQAADWTRDEPAADDKPATDVDSLRKWVAEHPQNYWGLRNLAERLLADKQWSEAKDTLDRMSALGVLTDERGGPLQWMSIVQQALDDPAGEQATIEKILATSSDALPTLRRWIEMNTEQSNWPEVLDAAQQSLAIQPLLPEFHIAAAAAAEKLGNEDAEQTALAALLVLNPIDPAGLHFRLAKSIAQQTGGGDDAKRQLLMALELAPRYREAHRFLLQMKDPKSTSNNEMAPTPVDAAEPPSPSDPATSSAATGSVEPELAVTADTSDPPKSLDGQRIQSLPEVSEITSTTRGDRP